MKKNLLFLFVAIISISYSLGQNSYTIFDEVIYYDGYAGTVDFPVPDGMIRINNAAYSAKLSQEILTNLSEGSLSMEVIIGALCDNYDRLGEVFLAFVEKGAETYNRNEVTRIEIARYITPFMNKNIEPKSLSYEYRVDNVADIFKDESILEEYDIWVELEVFGVPYAANEQVAGCEGRNDVFTGSLVFHVDLGEEQYVDEHFILPLSTYEILNNYNNTDVPGETTKIMNFTLTEPVEDAVLYVITSNHGANAGGEEYKRREHYIYLDDELIFQYKPGGKSCEPYRQYNTQGNGIYGWSPKSIREWLSFNNWCPGDRIPNREVYLGTLSAGEHTITLDVPDATFIGNEGYFPISMYIQNRKSGQQTCTDPTHLIVENQYGTTVDMAWTENGDSNHWELLWGRRFYYEDTYDNYMDVEQEPKGTIENLFNGWYFEVFVRSSCADNFESVWVGPTYTDKVVSVEDEHKEPVDIFPNPSKGIFTIQSPIPVEKVTVYGIGGETLLVDSTTQINIENFSPGIYNLIINLSNGEVITKKVIKY